MSYTIYNADGTILLTLGDSKIDKLSTSLTLVGKNVNAYGEYWNNNLVKLLENFANTEQPTSPVIGQLWYDTSTGRLNVYDIDNQFRPVTNTIASDIRPETLAASDFWFDTVNKQLHFTIDGQDDNLIGPLTSAAYGEQGWILETIGGNPVTSLYSNGTRVAILSTTSFAVTTSGFTTVEVGINLANNIPNIKFVGTATNADKINGLDTAGILIKDVDQTTQGSLTIINDQGLTVLNSSSYGVNISTDPITNHGIILNQTTNGAFDIRVVNSGSGVTSAIYADANTKTVGVWNAYPQYPLDVVGDARIQGSLIVEGTSTYITSVNLQINDSQIELGYGQITPNDAYADAGGIVLYGATPKSILWESTIGWTSSEPFNIASANDSYLINGATVLSQTSLGLVVNNAPGLTSVGTLSHLTVTNVYLSGNTIQPIGTGVLNITATSYVSFGNTRVTNVKDPVYNTDAANKEYVDNSLYLVGTKSYGISLDASNFSANFGSIDDGVKYYLDQLFPVFNEGGASFVGEISGTLLTISSLTTGTVAVGQKLQPINGVLANTYIVAEVTGNPLQWVVNLNQTISPGTSMVASGDSALDIPDGVRAKVLVGTTVIPTTTATVNVNWATDQVDKGGVQFTATVVAGLAGSIASQLPAQIYAPVTTYTVQTWRVLTSIWTKLY